MRKSGWHSEAIMTEPKNATANNKTRYWASRLVAFQMNYVKARLSTTFAVLTVRCIIGVNFVIWLTLSQPKMDVIRVTLALILLYSLVLNQSV